MKTMLEVATESWPINGSFTISRGSRTTAEVVVCRLSRDGATGSGECVPYRRYGETVESVMAAIEAARPAVEAGAGRVDLMSILPGGAARNAIDCALWDLEAKLSGSPVGQRVAAMPLRPVVTAVTISLGTPAEMAAAMTRLSGAPLVKVKLGGEGDQDRIEAVCAAAGASRIILDANEAWTPQMLKPLLRLAARNGVVLIEQPLPAGMDDALADIPHPVPVCADESAHLADDLESLVGRYDCINVKLDKTGGLTAALETRDRAHALGFSVMAGCMVGTSLSMAPAVLLAQACEYADLDGPLILARDREHGLAYADGRVFPSTPALWG
jgi:L-alanine-DL-glutamate epimerase-like enolase superfamily enzyme